MSIPGSLVEFRKERPGLNWPRTGKEAHLHRTWAQYSFMREKPPFNLDAPSVPGEGAIGCHHAMARDDDGNGISPVRRTDRPGGPRLPGQMCDLAEVAVARTVSGLMAQTVS
jgi:hypothetical protein